MTTRRAVRSPAILAFTVLLLALIALLAAAPARAALSFPPLTGRVVDDAHVLSPDVQASLTQTLAGLETKTGRQLVVVTLPSLQGDEISDYGYQLGRAWGVGQKGKDTGALFIIVPSEKKVRIEVGYGLEPILTDALTSVILQQQVLPKFRSGDIQGGVVDGTNTLAQQLGADAQTAQANAAQANAALANAQASQSAANAPRRHNGIGTLISVVLVVFVLSAFFRGGRRGGGMGWMLPLMFFGGGFGGGGGGRDDDSEGGGGFSGGGGSFGGGGSSGSW